MVGVDFEDKEIVVMVCVLEVDDEDTWVDIFKVVESGEVAVLEMGEKGCDDKTVVVVWAFKVKEVSVAPVNKELESKYICNGKRFQSMSSFNIPTGKVNYS